MTRPTPDWFGKPDPEMKREFLGEMVVVEHQALVNAIKLRQAKFLANLPPTARLIEDYNRQSNAARPTKFPPDFET